MRKKRLASLFLAFALVFALAACSSNTDQSSSQTQTSQEENVSSTEDSEASEIDDSTQSSEDTDAEESETTETETSETETSDLEPVTITTYDYEQNPVEETFDSVPQRVVAVYQDSIETLLELGLADRIVAAAGLDQDVKEEYSDDFANVNYLTEFTPDKETVLMEEPDLIVSWHSYFSDDNIGDVDQWNEQGVNTYTMLNSGATETRSLENEYTDILNLGKIFRVEDKAQEIVDKIKDQVDSVVEATKDIEEKPSVLMLEVESDDLRVYGDNTLGGDMISQLGADLVTADNNTMSSEALIEENPDVIFTVYYGSSSSLSDADSAVAEIVDDPKYASLSAVQNDRVYAIGLGDMYCSGTRTIDGIQKLAAGIYPTLDLTSDEDQE